MRPSADIPHLKVVATSKLHPHELPDEQRARPLVSALRRDRVLKNPPVVLPFENGEQFVVLDGANRVTALRLLDSPHALVQVASLDREKVELRTWNHVLMGLSVEQARATLTASRMIDYDRSRPDHPALNPDGLLRIEFSNGDQLAIDRSQSDLHQRIELLNEVVDAYRGQVHFERTSEDSLMGMGQVYNSVAALVVFPEFRPDEVVQAAAENWHFPPGITRFIISPRALRLNYPLAMLDSDETLEEKQQHLSTWIRSRVQNRRVRFYAESTFLFDE
jgi:hypothetical protein